MQAINHKEADHVPLTFRDTNLPETYGKPCRNQFEAVDIFLKLGVDPMLYLAPDYLWELNPKVKERIRKEKVAGEPFPYLFKEYDTPKGVLRQIVRQTPDWPHRDNVPLWSDHMIPRSRSKKYLIENMDDMESFSSLFGEPTEKELESFHEKAERFKRFAEDRGVIINGGDLGIAIGDIIAWICGIENAVLWSFRRPELLHRLLDITLEWNVMYARQILEVGGVDVVTCRGYYENADFWSPRIYKTFFAPRLQKLIEVVHRGGAKFCYHMTTGIMPLLEIFREIGVDILFGPDPVEGKADLEQVKDRVGDRICLWGGMNAPVTLGTGTQEQIEDGVREAISKLAPGGGFILSALDSLILGSDAKTCGSIPWASVEHMIKVWRKMSNYPIS